MTVWLFCTQCSFERFCWFEVLKWRFMQNFSASEGLCPRTPWQGAPPGPHWGIRPQTSIYDYSQNVQYLIFLKIRCPDVHYLDTLPMGQQIVPTSYHRQHPPTDSSFPYASACLWNQFPVILCQSYPTTQHDNVSLTISH